MKRLTFFVICLLLLVAFALPSFAASENFASWESYTAKSSPIVTFSYFLQLVFSLLIVIGLIYVVSKYLLPKLQVKTQGKVVEVIERVGLEPQVTAYILRIKRSSWLVVVSNKQVTKIDKIEEDLSAL
ncbi:MAG: hypothetical protein NT099_04355 [Candidatus Saganbacteria bacterium]|nr:hypothetical protein [Candidatus Saganbacteria bacterium]